MNSLKKLSVDNLQGRLFAYKDCLRSYRRQKRNQEFYLDDDLTWIISGIKEEIQNKGNG